MASTILSGLGVALITPFKEDYSIDTEALEALVEHTIAGGADYLVALGTTAETPTLTPEEREEVKNIVKLATRRRVPLVLGMSSNSTNELCHHLRHTDMEGYDAILSVVPFYNKPSQRGIEAHYRAVADASPLPVILYNVPGRTGVNMDAATTLRLASSHPNIIAVKEASGNIHQIEKIICGAPEDFDIISGDDGLTMLLMALGAQGVISVAANAFPRQISAMVKQCLEGNFCQASMMHRSCSTMFELLFREGNPAGIKAALASMGMIKNVLRLPLTPVGAATQADIDAMATAIQQ